MRFFHLLFYFSLQYMVHIMTSVFSLIIPFSAMLSKYLFISSTAPSFMPPSRDSVLIYPSAAIILFQSAQKCVGFLAGYIAVVEAFRSEIPVFPYFFKLIVHISVSGSHLPLSLLRDSLIFFSTPFSDGS